MGVGQGRRPHARVNLVNHAGGLHNLHAVVETAGLALYDEKPKRITRFFRPGYRGLFVRKWPWVGTRQGRPTQPRAAVRAAPAPPPVPRQFRIRGLRIQNEANSTPRTAPRIDLCRPSLIYLRNGSVQVERLLSVGGFGFEPSSERVLSTVSEFDGLAPDGADRRSWPLATSNVSDATAKIELLDRDVVVRAIKEFPYRCAAPQCGRPSHRYAWPRSPHNRRAG